MITRNFGIEIEFTGITRERTATILSDHLGGEKRKVGRDYKVVAPDGRVWQIVYDGSIRCQKRVEGQKVPATNLYSVEIVSPILSYEEDIESLQEMIRKVRRAGGFANKTTGIHYLK